MRKRDEVPGIDAACRTRDESVKTDRQLDGRPFVHLPVREKVIMKAENRGQTYNKNGNNKDKNKNSG